MEVRAASHAVRKPRSGSMVLDIQNLHLSNGSVPDATQQDLRFADTDGYPELTRKDSEAPVMATAQWQRLVFAYTPPGESRAVSLLSLGPRPMHPVQGLKSYSGSPLKVQVDDVKLSPEPLVTVSQGLSKLSSNFLELTTLVLTVDIPSVFVKLSKNEVDGLQLWADDISRITESAFASRPNSANSSRDPSLIGSRFFAKTRRSDGSTVDSMSTVTAQRTGSSKETVIKATVGEGMFYNIYGHVKRQNID